MILPQFVKFCIRQQYCSGRIFERTFKVEIDPYARSVLRSRMEDGLLHPGKIWDDVEQFKAPAGTKAVGCGGGFPCQAGLRCYLKLFQQI